MKKIVLIVTTLVLGALIIGCGDDEKTKADLRWENQANGEISKIEWYDFNSGDFDQGWGETLSEKPSNYERTDYKGIKSLDGQAEALFDGAEARLDLAKGEGVKSASSNNATIIENANATLIIEGAKKK